MTQTQAPTQASEPTHPGEVAVHLTEAGSARRDIFLVARREFVERGRDRAFLISALVTILIIVAIVVLPALFSKPTTYKIGVVGAAATRLADATIVTATAGSINAKKVPMADEATARQAVTKGDVDVVLLDDQRALVKDKMPPELAVLLSETARNVHVSAALQATGLSDTDTQAVLTATPLAVTALHPKNADDGTRKAVALFTLFILYGQLIGYAMWVANGVVEEKSSRVIEVLAAAVRPRRLMTGKVLGIGGLALIQLLAVTMVAVAASLLVGKTRIPADSYGSIGVSFVWFLAGFAFFAFLFAGAASMVSRQEDLQNIVTPLTLVLMGSLFAGLQASSNPDATLSKILSFVPPISSVVMPTRYAAGGVPLWQVGVSFVILLVAVGLVIRLAGRIYSNSILKGRSKWREALRGTSADALEK